MKKKEIPLIIEPHPKYYNGFPFITLLQYRKSPLLTIVDNMDDDIIKAFVMDWCGPEGVNEETILGIASHWFNNNRSQHPLSIEIAKLGLTNDYSRIYRSFNTEFISRVIGPVPKYPMTVITSIKRRRKKSIPDNIEVIMI